MKKISVILLILIVFAGCSGTRPDLGINNGRLMPCPGTPNCVSSQATDENYYTEPLRFMGTPQDAHGRLLNILESEQRTKLLEIRADYIRAEFTSALFGFTDDVEFYLPQKQDHGTLIHIRSASRLGYFDFGANKRRVDRIRSKLKELIE